MRVRKAAKFDEASVNFMLAVIKGIKPRDHLEAMLAGQMAAIHMATMTFTGLLAHVENIPQQDSAERALNKLARTYASQMEALKRYRTGGEQKVTVQHVSVSEGGQAIVGNVTQGCGRYREKPANTTPALTDAAGKPEMPRIIDKPERAPVALRRRQEKKWRAIIHVIPLRCGRGQRCGAKTRSGRSLHVSGGEVERNAVGMHGGAPGSGAPRGNKNALKHGRYTREAIEERRQLRALLRQSHMLGIQKIE